MRKWAVRAALVAMFVAAALLVRVAPVASAILLLVPTVMFGIAWWVMRGNERVVAAAKRGDLESLEKIARTRKTSRYLALVTLAMHGGVARVRDLGDRVFCVCGECELDENDRELEIVMRALQLVEGGHADRAFATLRAHKMDPKVLPPAPAVHVAVMLYVCLMTGVELGPDRLKQWTLPSLRAPIDLALAQCLSDRGDSDRAAAVLASAEPSDSPRLREWRAEIEKKITSS